MDEQVKIDALKHLLRQEVSDFCQHNRRKWKTAVSHTIDEIRERNWPAVFFGGTLRSLLLSRLEKNAPGRPRDVDIVVDGVHVSELQEQFSRFVARQTRFGGLRLQRVNWEFDLWPLQETLAFKEDAVVQPEFGNLPYSTFFNLEAIAVEIWPQPGLPRRIFSADDQFFRGVLSKTLEINREESPYIDLCIARAYVMAARLNWKVGPKLLRYIAKHGPTVHDKAFEDVQMKHYGNVLITGSFFRSSLNGISDFLQMRADHSYELPFPKQLSLWPFEEVEWPQITIRAKRSGRN